MSITSPLQELMKTWLQVSVNAIRPTRTIRLRRTVHSLEKPRGFATARELRVSHVRRINSSLETLFINVLVQAGSCKRLSRKRPLNSKFVSETKRDTWVQSIYSYNRLPLLVREDAESIGAQFSKKRLIGLVDYYDYSYEQGRQAQSETAHYGANVGKGNTKLGGDVQTYRQRRTFLKTLDESTLKTLDKVTKAIHKSHQAIIIARNDKSRQQMDHILDNLFTLYYALPQERFLCLDRESRQKLLDLARTTPKKTVQATLRFLSLLQDVSRTELYVSKAVYNHAIHLVGRTLGKVSHKEVESALRRWTLMETSSSGNATTFNILFDVAVKGQQFALAEMVLSEMAQRGIEKDRFTRVSLIYYYGIRGDGDAIRRAYQDLVEKDVIVDTTVLNCVIASLLRAGEAEAAQHVYRRMKDIASKRDETAVRDQTSSKERGKALRNMVFRLDGKDQKLIRQLQEEQDISPDSHTFTILISYHVSETGDFGKISQYLSEMNDMGIPGHGRIFMELFRGFCFHGREVFTLWNLPTLDRIFAAFRDHANQQANKRVYWDKWVVLWLLRAYTNCGDRDIAMEKWMTIKEEWRGALDHEIFMLEVIDAAAERPSEPRRRKRIASAK